MAENIVESIIVKLGLDGSQYNREADKAVGKNKKLTESVSETDKVVGNVTKTLARWFSVAAAATGLIKLVDQVQQLNDELYFLERNLGMSSQTIKNWQGAASAMGGSAQGMTESMKSLNMGMNDFVVMGDTTLLPFMNALGVSMVDTQGHLRKTDDVMLDLADSFSKMDREQAFSIASKMGIDEGTFNTLVQGRQEMEKMIAYQNTMYKSSEAELQASRDLAKNRALIGSQWESLKTMLGNAVVPLFVKLSEVALGMFNYLQEHQREVQAVFKALAFVIGAVLTPILIKATIAALAFIAPFIPFIATVGALGAAFGLLYDDYKTWAEGGKSLFDWGAFSKYIDNATLSTDNLKNAFKNLYTDMINNTIPTLRGYAEIVEKLMSGDFKGAGKQAWGMIKQFGSNVAGVVDDLTGQEKGTLEQAAKNLINPQSSDGNVGGGTGRMFGRTLNLTDQDVIDIMKVASTEVAPNLKNEDFEKQAAGVVDTILNRAASGKYGVGVRGVANQRWAFSDINSPRKSAYGSVEKVPMSRVSTKMQDFVKSYLSKRAAGMPSIVGQNVSYANPNFLGEASESTKKWVAEVERQAKASGQVFGSGKSIHVHGTPSADRNKMPQPFNVTLGNSSAQSMQIQNAQESMRQSDKINLAGVRANQPIANQANNVEVNVDKVNIQTTSPTMTGTGQDMALGLTNGFLSQRPSFK